MRKTKTLDKKNKVDEWSLVHGGLQCLKCEEIVVSLDRHDFRSCGCGATFIDGGRAYMRYGGDPKKIKSVRVRLSKGYTIGR